MGNSLTVLKTDVAKMQGEFAKSLPGHITAEKFVRTAQTAISMTRNIDKVNNTQALMGEICKAAADGLILDGREAALVIDYKGNPQYRPMMRGLLKLAHNSGELKGTVVEVARKGDVFRHRPTSLDEPIVHEINHEAERGDVFVVYAFAELRSGGIVHEVMSVPDINRIRDRSDAWRAFKEGKIKSTPWSTDWEEMARKTVFRRISKYLPSSTDRDRFNDAVERIDNDYNFEIDAHATEPAAPKTAPKQRGGAAALMKNVTPKQQESRRAPAKDQMQERYDGETGEILDGEYSDEQLPGDDI